MIYYVYKLLDPQDNQPFYIGKGKNKRCESHLNGIAHGENKRKDQFILELRQKGYEPLIEIIHQNLKESDAYMIEEFLIEFYGRKDYDYNGILLNICKSNRPPNHKGRKRSKETIKKMRNRIITEETRKKLSDSKKGINNPMFGKIGPNKGKIFTKEHVKKMSESHKGKKQSEETITKRLQTRKDKGITISRKTIDAAAKKRRGMKLPKEWIEKRTKTRRAKNNYKRKPESVLKGMKTTLTKNDYDIQNKSDEQIKSIYGSFLTNKRYKK